VKADGMVATNTTTGESWSSLDSPEIPAGSWLWIVVEAASGTVVSLHTSVRLST
jgi:hypothetical protein